MPHNCRHRTLTTVISNPDPPTFSVPSEPGPIDELLVYLCSKNPEVDEVIVNAMALMFSSQRALALIETTGNEINNPGSAMDIYKPISKETMRALELLMAMGFLTGTAIGFAAGLEFESSEDDDDGDNGFTRDEFFSI